ncbi:MAG: right-handed parallel beta-helix repeat-containing protein [Candidatus Hydrogenedentes bacterium]|nr:right-handed parallel beta-helix repeat-containing protein [Candidatus Hydrogenedentota bacterium]
MRSLGAVLGLLIVAGWAQGATLEVPGQYPSIQAAIDAAGSGDTVKIAAGSYKETLKLKGGVSLSGESRDTTVLQNFVDKGPLLNVLDCSDPVEITGIALEHINKETGEQRRWPDLLIISNSNAKIRLCTFRKSGGCGIVVTGSSECEISECLFEENAQSGIIVRGTDKRVKLANNTCRSNNNDGIHIWNSKVEAASNTCEKNSGSGICAMGDEADVNLTGNTCTGNGWGLWLDGSKASLDSNTCSLNTIYGIYASTGAEVRVTGNVCRENGDSGIVASSVGTRCEAVNNTCAKNKVCGISYIHGAQGAATDNVCEENGEVGFNVARWRSKATFQGNKALNNGGSGIRVRLNSTAELIGNECRDNKDCGILIVDEGSSAEEKDNTVENNAGGGVERREGLPLNRQYWVKQEEVGRLLGSEQFEALEQFAAELREHKPRPLDGPFELESFYEGIEDGYGTVTAKRREGYRPVLDRWAAAYPDSAAPLIAKAQAEISYAWEARGRGWASETTPEGRKDFKKYLQNAEQLLHEAEAKDGKDAYLYALLMEVARGLSYDLEKTEEVFKKGVALDPWHVPLYERMVWYLLPRWHGEPGDMEAFVQKVGEETREEMGGRMYSQLVAHAAIYCDLEDAELVFPWEKVDEGFRQLMEDYPECSYLLNCYCNVACLYKKQALAKELFERIGRNVREDAWNNEEEAFRTYKQWAYGTRAYPSSLELGEEVTPEDVEEFINKFRKGSPVVGAVIFLGVAALIALIVMTKGRA